ncbi:MAG: porD [candidate division NC10 bacterium]|jgi:aerobic-type carbon monoxide dehydrogenase small subunit (CoxS/CutS family)|nr:porD [candidate division NC10 bacterium]
MPKRPPKNVNTSFSVSRRTFLKTVGVGAAATGLVAPTPRTAEARVLGPDAVLLRLTVNGAAHTVTVEPRVTLLRTLRDYLGLTGAKEVCERGACGGCTVLFDGEPVCACMMLAVDAVGHEITTVEGLGTPEKLSPVQAAFVECDAFQCGFCTPGFVVASTALLKKHPNPSLAEIKAGLSGNLCRCGTYSRIFEAVNKAARQRG